MNQTANNKNHSSFFKSTFLVTVSNIVLLLAGLLSGFLIPKILGVNDYGMFKTFSLYTSYTSFFQLGFINGIYLKYGGKDLGELDIKKFRLFFKVFFFLELAISLVAIGISFIWIGTETFQIMGVVIAFSFSNNLTTYFQLISQTTQRFKEYSIRLIVQSGLKLILISVFFVLYILNLNSLINYIFYTFLYVLIFAILLIWYLFTYRSIVFGESAKLSDRQNRKDVFSLFAIGFPLLIADFTVTLVYNAGHQIVNWFLPLSEFSYFSLAYTFANLVSVLVNAVSTILYPTLKRASEQKLKSFFQPGVLSLLTTSFLLISLYFPGALIIQKFLPAYTNSISILKIIFPGTAISIVINIFIQNYYKTLNKNWLYFWICLGLLAGSVGLDFIFLYSFHSSAAIAWASVITIFVWFVISQIYFVKKYNIKIFRTCLYALFESGTFYLACFFFDSLLQGFLCYIFLFLLSTLCFFPKEIFALIKKADEKIHPSSNKEKNQKVSQSKQIETFTDRLRRKRKNYLAIFLSFSCLFLSSSFFGSVYQTGYYDNLADAICLEKKQEDVPFSYAQVSSTDQADRYTNFLVLANNSRSVNIADDNDVFFSSKKTDSFSPITIQSSNILYDASVICSTRNDTGTNHLGFSLLLAGSFETFVTSHEIYISQSLAGKLLTTSGIENYDGLINQSFLFAPSLYSSTVKEKCKILGIIDSTTDSKYRTLVGDDYVFSNANFAFYFVNSLKFSCFMLSGEASTSSLISVVEPACKKAGAKYVSSYFNYSSQEKTFYLGSNQVHKNQLSAFEQTGKNVCKVIGCLSLFSSLFLLIFSFIKNKAALTSTCKYNAWFISLLVLISFVATLITDFGLSRLFLHSFVPIYLSSYSGLSLSFLTALGLLLIFHPSIKKTDNIQESL